MTPLAPILTNAIAPLLAAPPAGRPTLPSDATWVGVMVIVILTLFLAAMIIGPIIRLNALDQSPDTHSTREPPGHRPH